MGKFAENIVFVTSRTLHQKTAVSMRPIAHCNALSSICNKVRYVVLSRKNEIHMNSQYWDRYKMGEDFDVSVLKSPVSDKFRYKKYVDLISHFLYALFFIVKMRKSKLNNYLFYSFSYNDLLPYVFLYAFYKKQNRPIFRFEIAHFPAQNNFIFDFVLKRCDKAFVETSLLRDKLVQSNENAKNRIEVLRNSPINVTLEHMQSLTKENARKIIENNYELTLPEKIICFSGTFYKNQKAIEIMIESVSLLGEQVKFIVIGGMSEDDVEYYRKYIISKGISNIDFVGFVSPNDVKYFIASADILLLYYSSETRLKYWSPVKMHEYMAAGRVIIASEFDELGEVLVHNKNALFVKRDDVKDLYKSIENALSNDELSQELSMNALKDARNYTLEERVRRIAEI